MSSIQDRRREILDKLSTGYPRTLIAQELKAVASDLFSSEREGTATYKTLDELIALEPMLATDYQTIIIPYFCILAKNHNMLTRSTPGQVAARLQDPVGVERILREKSFNIRLSGISERGRDHLNKLFDEGYIALFGRRMYEPTSPTEIKDSQKPDSPTSNQYSVIVYFGGKRFAEIRDEVGKLIPLYQGRTGSEEIMAGGRTVRLFRINMSAGEYTRMLETVLGSAVQAVKVPLTHTLNRSTLNGAKIAIEERDGDLFLYNSGQMQPLAQHQAWALGRALTGQTGHINSPPISSFGRY